MKHLARIIATGLYSGYFPFAPGTVGSGVGLFIYICLPGFRSYRFMAVSVLLFFIGVWAATQVEKTDGHDASIINVDEIVGMWISLWFLPSSLSWYGWIGGFFVFRLFDIMKPFPANISQKLSRGWGVMMDDIIAGIYTNIVLQILHIFISR